MEVKTSLGVDLHDRVARCRDNEVKPEGIFKRNWNVVWSAVNLVSTFFHSIMEMRGSEESSFAVPYVASHKVLSFYIPPRVTLIIPASRDNPPSWPMEARDGEIFSQSLSPEQTDSVS